MDNAAAPQRVATLGAMALTFLAMTVLAIAVKAIFGPGSLLDAFPEGESWALQCAWGAGLALCICIPLVAAVVRLRFFARLREHSLERARMIDLRGWNPLWISLMAGVGEELLFRGAIQPLLGIWLTSILFALGHIQPDQYRKLRSGTLWYAGFVFLVSLLLGSLFARLGLAAAMAFHATGDLVGTVSLRIMSRNGSARS